MVSASLTTLCCRSAMCFSLWSCNTQYTPTGHVSPAIIVTFCGLSSLFRRRRRRAAARSIFNPSALSPQRRSKRQAGSSRRRARAREIEPRENTLAHSQPDLWIWPTPLSAQVLSPLLTARCLHSHTRLCVLAILFFFSQPAASISHWAGLVARRGPINRMRVRLKGYK